MDAENLKRFKVRQAPSAKFYVTRQEQAFCTRDGRLVYFERERDAWKFLAEIGDIVLKPDNGRRRSRGHSPGRGAIGHVRAPTVDRARLRQQNNAPKAADRRTLRTRLRRRLSIRRNSIAGAKEQRRVWGDISDAAPAQAWSGRIVDAQAGSILRADGQQDVTSPNIAAEMRFAAGRAGA
jgi:hypothetical protein